jgi:type I restriction-modification system DNA methylase subunit
MTTHDALGSDPATSQARNAVWRFLDLARGFDPVSAGLVQSEKFVESQGGNPGDFSSCGQESNSTTRHLAIMNLAIRGIEADFGPEHADTFRHDLLTAHSRN